MVSTALWAAAWIAYEVYGPELPLFADLAIIFFVMPMVAGLASMYLVQGHASRTALPIDLGFPAGATIRLAENVPAGKRRAVELFLLTGGASAQRVREADLLAGLRLFVNASPREVREIAETFARRDVPLTVDSSTTP
jgi:hypothetical protein